MFQQHVRKPLSVRPAMEFPSKTQLWEDRCNRPDNVVSRPDILIHKASIAFKSRRPDVSPLGLDARASDMEIRCIGSTVRTTIPLVRTREALIWKLLAAEVRPYGRQGTTVWKRLKTGKNFREIFESRSHNWPSERPMTTVRTAPRFYQARRSFEPSTYK